MLKSTLLVLAAASITDSYTISFTQWEHIQGEAIAQFQSQYPVLSLHKVKAASLLSLPSARYFQQRIDHFNGHTVNKRFPQKYYESSEYVKSNTSAHPIFLYIGGEGPLSPYTFNSSALLSTMAKRFGAQIYALEHRFYGESLPLGPSSLNSKSLQYLSSQQALADLIHFLSSKRLSQDQPIIVFGCSYPGNLAAWVRSQYPHMVAGAIASSAPIEARSNFSQYDKFLAFALSSSCRQDVSAALEIVEAFLERSPERTLGYFRCSSMVEDVKRSADERIAFHYVLADAIAFAVQYNNPKEGENSAVGQLCHYSEEASKKLPLLSSVSSRSPVSPILSSPLPVSSLDDGEEESDGKWKVLEDVVERFSRFVKMTYERTGSGCKEQWMTLFDEDTKSKSMRAWLYQSCSSFGYWQTANEERQFSARSTQIDLSWHLRLCEKLFPLSRREREERDGEEEGEGEEREEEEEREAAVWPREVDDQTNALYGGLGAVPTAMTNVHFTNGSKDPWMTLSPTGGDKEASERNRVSYHVIDGGSHCNDFGVARSEEVKSAQDAIEKAIGTFLDDFEQRVKGRNAHTYQFDEANASKLAQLKEKKNQF